MIRGLNMVLEIKSNRQIRKLPIIILTTTNNLKDITVAYYIGANSYLKKILSEGEMKEFEKMIKI